MEKKEAKVDAKVARLPESIVRSRYLLGLETKNLKTIWKRVDVKRKGVPAPLEWLFKISARVNKFELMDGEVDEVFWSHLRKVALELLASLENDPLLQQSERTADSIRLLQALRNEDTNSVEDIAFLTKDNFVDKLGHAALAIWWEATNAVDATNATLTMSTVSLGSGAYGKVQLARLGGQALAIKSTKDASHWYNTFRALDEEIKLFRLIGVEFAHENVVNFRAVYKDIGPGLDARLAMEYCWFSLYHMKANDMVDFKQETVLACIILQLLRGLAHLHAHGVLHLDLKPANVMYAYGALKLTDFGLGFDMDSVAGNMMRDVRAAHAVVRHVQELDHAGLGTPGFRAPEIMRAKCKADGRADIYSLGVSILCLVHPMKIVTEVSEKREIEVYGCFYYKDHPVLYADSLHAVPQENLRDLTRQCLEIRFECRMHAKDAIERLEGWFSPMKSRPGCRIVLQAALDEKALLSKLCEQVDKAFVVEQVLAPLLASVFCSFKMERPLGKEESLYDSFVPLQLSGGAEALRLISGETPKHVLIEGEAGIGKSTLARYLAQSWATEQAYKTFSLLIYVDLSTFPRDLACRPANLLQHSLKDCKHVRLTPRGGMRGLLFRGKSLFENVDALEKVLCDDEVKVLWLLDGVDCRNDLSLDSFKFALIFRRHSALPSKKGTVQLLGFESDKSRKAFLGSNSPLVAKVCGNSADPALVNLARVPLFLELLRHTQNDVQLAPEARFRPESYVRLALEDILQQKYPKQKRRAAVQQELRQASRSRQSWASICRDKDLHITNELFRELFLVEHVWQVWPSVPAEVDMPNPFGLVLDYAASIPLDRDVFKWLCGDMPVLYAACARGQEALVQEILCEDTEHVDHNPAVVLASLGHHHKVVKILVNTGSADPAFAASAYQNIEQFRRAVYWYEIALESKPNDILLLNNLGSVYTSLDELDKAMKAYELARQSLPDDAAPSEALADTLHNIGLIYSNQGKNNEAIRLYEQALRMYSEDQPMSIARTLTNMACALHDLGERDRVVVMYKKILELYKHPHINTTNNSTSGPVADVLTNMGVVLAEQGKSEDALNAYNRALQILRTVETSNSKLAAVLNNMGMVYAHENQSDKALALYEQALEIRRASDNPNIVSLARTWNNIGTVYLWQNRLDEALEAFQEAIDLYKKALNPNHPYLTAPLSNIAVVYKDTGSLAEAMDACRHALDIYMANPGVEQAAAATTLSTMASVYREQEDFDKALELEEKALNLNMTSYGETSERVAKSLSNVALTHKAMGNPKFALDFCERALSICEDKLWITRAQVLNIMGSVYAELDRLGEEDGDFLDQAIKAQRQALEITKIILGPKEKQVLDICTTLSTLHARKGETKIALEVLKEVVDLSEEPSVKANALNNIGIVLAGAHKLEQARQAYDQALVLMETVHGPNHHSVADTLNNIANLLERQNRPDDALHVFDKVLEIYKANAAIRPNAEPETLASIGTVHKNKGDLVEALNYYKRAVCLFENIPGQQVSVALALNNIGDVHRREEDFDKALQVYQQAIDKFKSCSRPQNGYIASTLFAMSEVYKLQGREELAQETSDRAFALADQSQSLPENMRPLYDRLRACKPEPGNDEAALTLVKEGAKQILSQCSEHIGSVENLCQLAEQLESIDLELALEAFEKALHLLKANRSDDPAIPGVLGHISAIYRSKGEMNKSMEACEELVEFYLCHNKSKNALSLAMQYEFLQSTLERLLQDTRVDPLDALFVAAELGHLGTIEHLFAEATVDPSANDNLALRIAAQNGHYGVVAKLLDDDRVDPASDENSAICTAAEHGHLDVLERLLQYERVDPSANENYPIIEAAENNHLQVVERLLQDPRVNAGADNDHAVRIAASNGHTAIVDRLLQEPSVNPASRDNYSLRVAVQHGHVDTVVRLLQDSRVDPSAANDYAIRIASQNGHLELVEVLLNDSRVNPGTGDNYAIRFAAQNGHVQIVRRLLRDARVEPSDLENATLLGASQHGQLAVVEELLKDRRVDPSARDNSAIVLASHKGSLAVVESLLNDPRVDPSGLADSAIRLAAQNGYLAVVERLLQDERVHPGVAENAALLCAVMNNHPQVVEALLRHPQVQAPPQIDAALLTVNADITKALLKHGTNPETTGGLGWTAVAHAAAKGDRELVRFLRLHKVPAPPRTTTHNFVETCPNKHNLQEKEPSVNSFCDVCALSLDTDGFFTCAESTEKACGFAICKSCREGCTGMEMTAMELAMALGHEDVAEMLREERRVIYKG